MRYEHTLSTKIVHANSAYRVEPEIKRQVDGEPVWKKNTKRRFLFQRKAALIDHLI